MKIAFFELEGWEDELLRQTFDEASGFEYTQSREKLESTHLPERRDAEIISVFVNSRITKAVIDEFKDLKHVVTRSTGFDHIDIGACAERGITVSYVPGYGDNTVAEFAFGLLLNLTRKLYTSIDRLKETGSFSLEGLKGVDIKGKTMGIIGTGRIGKEMIKISNGFGMNVLAFDLYPAKDLETQLNFRYTTLDDVLKNSDVVSLHTPYTKETHHLINMTSIKFMKKGSYLINTARGGLIETDALVWALREGLLAGAGLDVLEEEGETKDELAYLSGQRQNESELKTMLENHVLIKMPNVLIAPHNAFNTQEALIRILNTTFENIKGFSKGVATNLVPKI